VFLTYPMSITANCSVEGGTNCGGLCTQSGSCNVSDFAYITAGDVLAFKAKFTDYDNFPSNYNDTVDIVRNDGTIVATYVNAGSDVNYFYTVTNNDLLQGNALTFTLQ
jgi:hypothetical protein